MKQLKIALALLLMSPFAFGQISFESPKKAPQIGFSGNLVDFSASLPKIGKVDPGFSVMFWNGLTNHLDYSVRYNGLFSDYLKSGVAIDKLTDYKQEAELSFHLKALSDDHLFNPFLTAGIGLGTYAKRIFTPYVPLGIGVQVNLASEGYLYLQGNYRLAINDKKLDNNTFYSLGVGQPLGRRKAPIVIAPPPPPPPVLEEAPKDRDGDGIADSEDACPDQPGTAALHGCPDRDGDGIADTDDACPDEPGSIATNGCPDKDGDGVADKDDKCPTVSGPASNNGCPIVKEEVKKAIDEAAKAIYFVTNGDKIEKRSLKSLNIILDELKKDNDLKANISGHTDNVGKADKNQSLSERRAKAVADWLVANGIDAARLSSAGYGDTKPVADNATAKGRQLNRRTELQLHYD
jgi:OmpA-OmpF porin, OOP family